MTTETRAESLADVLEKLAELNLTEDDLETRSRTLAEERREIAAKLAKAEEMLERSTLNGLREPPRELADQVADLEARLHQINDSLGKNNEELEEIAHERIRLLKRALPKAWKRVQEAREKAFDPELRHEALEGVRQALEPFVAAQEELREAEEVLGALLRHAGRVDQRAPSLLRQSLTERHGSLGDPPSRDRTWRAVKTLVNVVGDAA